ncbi:MAG: MotA/TolQ/ExbB proton channel family protein [Myxococcales bacterium]|nr:MotA/TolQ/ExbB proton channel family protein [Myxococcales bacterium]MCB9642697.1 MotA/TolQ/ExbB proton channel family protein [Myxococcales bacterium]
MWPIYLCSILALTVFCQRLWLYRKISANQLPWVEPLLQRIGAMHYIAAAEQAEKIDHPVARVLAASSRIAALRPDRVPAEAERVGLLELSTFERNLPLLGLVSQIAPLLGLLGTVIGMVQLFFGLQSAGMANVNAAALSSGIWQALLTTAAGLVVAAPTLAGHHYLNSRVDNLRMQLRDSVERMLHVLPPLDGPWPEESNKAKPEAPNQAAVNGQHTVALGVSPQEVSDAKGNEDEPPRLGSL